MSITHARPAKASSGFASLVKMVIGAFIVALALQMLLVQSYTVPMPSMAPTLEVGDHVVVDKLAYGYSRYSFSYPGLGLDEGIFAFQGRVAASAPHRGDVVVFRDPHHKGVDDIKRLIGLPGDKIEIKGGVLSINGETIERKLTGDVTATDTSGQPKPAKDYVEALSSRVHYQIRKFSDEGNLNNTQTFTVPAGQYFMLGDNRDVSIDSRFADYGTIPAENLIGRAQMIYFSDKSTDPLWQAWTWPERFRLDRMFKML